MLKLAKEYEEEINKALANTWYDDKYKFYHYSVYRDKLKIPDGDWDGRHFVSVDSNNNLLGYINYEIVRATGEVVDGFGAINFTDNKVIFGKDLTQVIDDILCKFNHRKLEFSVVIGNPIERSYDRLVSKYGGRIVGIQTQHTKLYDGTLCDVKLYEIMREDYIKAKERIEYDKQFYTRLV